MNKKMTAVDALKILENAHGKDFYTTEYQEALGMAIEALKANSESLAHWIFSGDEEDYDGYYINCSKCGMQRYAYDQDGDLDIPVACPHCGAAIDSEAWEYRDVIHYRGNDKTSMKRFSVAVLHRSGTILRPYILDVFAKNEEEAKSQAIAEVARKFPADNDIHKKLIVDQVLESN